LVGSQKCKEKVKGEHLERWKGDREFMLTYRAINEVKKDADNVSFVILLAKSFCSPSGYFLFLLGSRVKEDHQDRSWEGEKTKVK
jgi:hypothetical protein